MYLLAICMSLLENYQFRTLPIFLVNCLFFPKLRCMSYLYILNTVVLHHAGLQGLYLSSFKTEKRAWSQQERHLWFYGQGILHAWCMVLEPYSTVYGWQQAGHGSSLCFQEEGEIGSYWGNYIRLDHQLPGKLAEGLPLITALIRTITSGCLGKVCRNVGHVCRV